MDGIFEWVKSIVFYLILLTVVTNLLPNKKYEKYVKLFTGMLLVIIVIKPVTQIFSWNEIFDEKITELLKVDDGFSMYDISEMDYGKIQEKQFLLEYQKQVEVFANTQAVSLGMCVVDLQLQIEQKEGIYVPSAIRMEVTADDGSLSGDEASDRVQIDEIKVADIVADKGSMLGEEQTRQLKNILMQYYGLEERRVQVVMT